MGWKWTKGGREITMNVLLLTVGGSPDPIRTAINTIKPERVLLFCTELSRKDALAIGETLPDFDQERDICIVPADDVEPCVERILEVIRGLRSDANAVISADITGGTKSMSASLCCAAMGEGCKLFITTAPRTTTGQISGGQHTVQLPYARLLSDQFLSHRYRDLINRYEYGVAAAEAADLLKDVSYDRAAKDALFPIVQVCEAFDFWDRFLHREALARLKPHMQNESLRPYGIRLRRILRCRQLVDPEFDAGGEETAGGDYEFVHDLVLNAQRCAVRLRYDDAVARLYRAVELLAQTRLAVKYGIQTSGVDASRLPDELRSSYQGETEIGMEKAYTLLERLGDPLGKEYALRRKAIHHALQRRNHSCLAHGFRPVQEDDYRKSVAGPLGELIASVAGDAALQPQLPTVW